MTCHYGPSIDAADQRLCLECRTQRTTRCDCCGLTTWWRDVTPQKHRHLCDSCYDLLSGEGGAEK